jgi:hypothetical protein
MSDSLSPDTIAAVGLATEWRSIIPAVSRGSLFSISYRRPPYGIVPTFV